MTTLPVSRPAAPALSKGREPFPLTASPYLGERHDRRYARAIIWTVVIAIGVFLYWASQTPVYEVVSGRGSIRPEGLSKRIEHLEGGIVAETLVEEGDVVQAGDVLMLLNDTDLRAEQRKLLARIERLDQSVAHHEALLALDLIEGRTTTRGLPPDVSAALVQEVEFRLAQVEVLHSEREVALAQQAALADRRVKLLEELTIIEGQRNRYENAGSHMVVPLRQLEELDREILRLKSTIRSLDGEDRVLNSTLAQVESRQAELVGSYRRDAALKLASEREEMSAAHQTISQIEERLRRSQLRAPVAGTVQGLTVQGSGEVIVPGEVVMEIIPQGVRAFAEVQIAAERIGGIVVGDQASLKVLTYDFTRYGDIAATVEHVSASSFRLENGQDVFRVKLSFDTMALQPLSGSGAEAGTITPGMTVVADIRSDRRTILAYLLKPVRIISDRTMTEA